MALELLFLHEADAAFGEIADHALHVSADIADLGVLGRLHLDERRADELGEPAGDLRLSDAGGSLHDDVLGRDLFHLIGRQTASPVAVPQSDRDGALRLVLPDDVFIQFVYDLFGR